MVERIDYSSDEEYEHALMLEQMAIEQSIEEDYWENESWRREEK